MLHPLLKNVFSSRLVSTLAITTHAPRCCEDCARLVADKLANGKEPKEGRQGCAIAIILKKRVQHTNTFSMRISATTGLFYRDLGARWLHDDSRWRPSKEKNDRKRGWRISAGRAPQYSSGLERAGKHDAVTAQAQAAPMSADTHMSARRHRQLDRSQTTLRYE